AERTGRYQPVSGYLVKSHNLFRGNESPGDIRRDPLWQGVKAVAEQRILFLSGLPFGWLDAPPGINRLLGLRRLHAWLDPAINCQFKSDMQHYAQLFWH
ncbi:hypothetical protein O5553_27950, partial [Escherichia coli]|nr:hypothetical protein [Escherichia coli]